MVRKMPRLQWQVAVGSLATSRQQLLEEGNVELHLLSERVRALLEERNNPAMAAVLLRQLIKEKNLTTGTQRMFVELAALMTGYAGVEAQAY